MGSKYYYLYHKLSDNKKDRNRGINKYYLDGFEFFNDIDSFIKANQLEIIFYKLYHFIFGKKKELKEKQTLLDFFIESDSYLDISELIRDSTIPTNYLKEFIGFGLVEDDEKGFIITKDGKKFHFNGGFYEQKKQKINKKILNTIKFLFALIGAIGVIYSINTNYRDTKESNRKYKELQEKIDSIEFKMTKLQ